MWTVRLINIFRTGEGGIIIQTNESVEPNKYLQLYDFICLIFGLQCIVMGLFDSIVVLNIFNYCGCVSQGLETTEFTNLIS